MSTKSGSKGVPRSEREAQILDAAAIEFGDRGYLATTTAAVAQRAGISKTLVHKYFQSKEDLYCACARRAGETLTRGIAEAMALPERPGLQRASDVVAAIFRALEQRPHDWKILHDRSVPRGGRAEVTARDYRRSLAEQAAAGVSGSYGGVLNEPSDLSALAQVWRETVTALVNWWLRNPEHTVDEMIARATRMFAVLDDSAQ